MGTELLALKTDVKDNVATVFSNEVQSGSEVSVFDHTGAVEAVVVSERIPYGHKIALRDIRKGAGIIKYGEVIGKASKTIHKGDYVHIHNLEATRGRGDLKAGDHA